MLNEKQLARLIFRTVSSIMKNTLNLEELSYREQGRNDPRYKTFKKHLMECTYSSLRDMLYELEDWGIIIPTEEEEDIRDGFRETLGGGAGFVNSKELDNVMEKLSEE